MQWLCEVSGNVCVFHIFLRAQLMEEQLPMAALLGLCNLFSWHKRGKEIGELFIGSYCFSLEMACHSSLSLVNTVMWPCMEVLKIWRSKWAIWWVFLSTIDNIILFLSCSVIFLTFKANKFDFSSTGCIQGICLMPLERSMDFVAWIFSLTLLFHSIFG